MKRKRRRRFPPPPIRLSVQNVTVRDGRVYLTCIHPRTGQIINNVAVLGHGGGDFSAIHFPVIQPTDPSQPAMIPESAGCTQGYVTFDRSGAPVYQGAVLRSQKSSLVPKTPDDFDEWSPHPGTWSPADFCLMNGFSEVVSKIIVDALGRMSLISDEIIRIQVADGKQVKIFSGNNSGMPVVLFVPTQGALNAIIERVNANTSILNVMAKYVGVLATAAAATGTDPTAAADVAAIAAWQEGQESLIEVGDEIASQTLLVPDDGAPSE